MAISFAYESLQRTLVTHHNAEPFHPLELAKQTKGACVLLVSGENEEVWTTARYLLISGFGVGENLYAYDTAERIQYSLFPVIRISNKQQALRLHCSLFHRL